MKLCPNCQRCYEDSESFCVEAEDHQALILARPGGRVITEKYQLDRLLGRGGMGAVYAGTHIELDRRIAVKLLLPESISDPRALERFRREARAAARVNHPNVADVYDFGVLSGGEAYIVMELIDGQTLREYIDAFDQFRISEAISITEQVANGISAAHQQGIIHRDLKPSNIILDFGSAGAQVVAKVVDFGIAQLKEQSLADNNSLTATGAFIGTPRYVSPEQCLGQEQDERSDIYSLGVILYEMLAGSPPFEAPSAMAVALKHMQQTPVPIADVRSDVTETLASLVDQMLRKDPAGRPQTASEVARMLREIENAAVVPTRLKIDLPIREKRALVAETVVQAAQTSERSAVLSIVAGTRARFLIAVAMAFALGFLVVWLMSRGGSTQATSIAKTEQQEKGSRAAVVTDERAALRAALNEWTSITNQGDFARLAALYMPQVTTFYLTRNVPREKVQAEKERLAAAPNSISIETNEPEILMSPDKRSATMRFNKQYTIGRGTAAARRGEVVQELRWQKTEEGWRIASERDLRVIRPA